MGGIIDIVVIGVIIVGAYYALSTGLLTEVIENVTSSIKGINIPMPGLPAGPGGGGGGGISGGGSCPQGETCKLDDQGRYDCENANFDAYEATWCGSFSGDDLTIKMYGPPHHSDGDCCWCVMHIKEDGKMVPGGEGPHPSSNCEHASGSNGKSGKATCYKGVMRPGPIQEGYALVNGKWELRATYKGACGCDKTSTKRTGNQMTFRCDGNFKTTCATVRPLGGGAPQAAYARGFYRPKSNFDRIGVH